MPEPALDLSRPAFSARVLSLTGVLPLGAFLVLHAALNARALGGEAPFVRVVGRMAGVPGLAVLEAVVIWVPLAVHAVVGVAWTVTRRPSLSPYPRAVRAAMRATGVLVLAFLAMHLPELRFRLAGSRPDGGQLLTLLAGDLSSMRAGLPWRAILYLLGSAAATFHFAAGLWGFFASTPRGSGARARRYAAWWAGAVGAVMWTLFVAATVYHATGARLLGGEPEVTAPLAPCPDPSARP